MSVCSVSNMRSGVRVCTKQSYNYGNNFTPQLPRHPCPNNAYFTQIPAILTLKNVSEPFSSVTLPIYTLLYLLFPIKKNKKHFAFLANAKYRVLRLTQVLE